MTRWEDRAHHDSLLESTSMLHLPCPSTDIFFQGLPGSNVDCSTTYSTPMESSPATISVDDFELLNSSSVFDPFDHGLLGLDSSTVMHCDEPPPSMESSDKWDSSGNIFAAWNSDSDPIWSKDVDPSLSEAWGGATVDPIGGLVSRENSVKMQESKGAVSTPHANVASTPKKRKGSHGSQGLKRSRSTNHVFKPSDSSENSDAFEDDEVGKDGKSSTSKNLVSERMRRRKLNERLFSLRALVPKISKMDKASIVSDAISYVQELQKQVDQIQADILTLESSKASPKQGPCHGSKNGKAAANSRHTKPFIEHRILEVDVSQMEEHTYHLRIQCKKGPGVLVQLTKALEALDLEIANANLTSINDNILNTIVVKGKQGESLAAEELKRLTLDVVPKFGFIPVDEESSY